MNFHRNTTSDKGATRVTHQAKAPSAGPTQATGSSRGLLRRALAARGASSGYKGSGAPASRRAPIALIAALAVIASLALAAPALAVPPSVSTPVVSDVSYTTVHVEGTITSDGSGAFGTDTTSWGVQYSTEPSDPSKWQVGFQTGFSNPLHGAITNKPVSAPIEGLKAGTEYFVRLVAQNGSFFPDPANPEATSPLPNPSFTTLAVDPAAIPGAVGASPVFSTSATATAKVKRPANSDPAFDVKCHFEYVSDEDFGTNGFANATAGDCAQNPVTEAKVDAGGELDVTAQLGCPNPVLEAPEGKCLLDPETTYHLRLVAENAAPGLVIKDAGATFTTGPKVAKPVVLAADDATEPSYSTAKVSGVVQRPAGTDPALDTSCRFEYVTDEQFAHNEDEILPPFEGAGLAPCVEAPAGAPLTGSDPTPVSAELTGLPLSTTGTTYHLRLTAENGGGTTSKDAADTFTTLPSKEPTLEINPVLPADVGYTTVHLTGTIDRGEPEHGITYGWQVSTDPDDWSGALGGLCCGAEPGKQEYSSGNDGLGNNRDPKSLKPGTKYYARFTAVDVTGGVGGADLTPPGPYESFTTKGTSDPPAADLDPITDFTATTAHFTGTVDPIAPAGPLDDEGKATYRTKWHIECTPECKDVHGNEIGGIIDGDAGAQPILGDATRLEPNKDYGVKLVATNILGTVESEQTFHTKSIPPSVNQTPGSPDGTGGYNLQGIVNPNNETITDCKFEWGPDAPKYAFSVDCSPLPTPGAKPTTVEAHLTSLNPDVDYHALLVVTYGAGSEAKGVDQTFKATLAAKEPCPANEQQRIESNSLALPECRAYEMVSPSGKEGFGAAFEDYDGGARVAYKSGAGNIAKSGQNGGTENLYVAQRSAAGWKTIPDLNGSSGSLYDAPSYVEDEATFLTFNGYSSDLLSSVWGVSRKDEKDDCPSLCEYFRSPDGTFALIGSANPRLSSIAVSADLSHLVTWSLESGKGAFPSEFGPGVYEFVGTGNAQPRRVDLDNSDAPISACTGPETANSAATTASNALSRSISADGRVIVVYVFGGCGGTNDPPGDELWARIKGTTSIDVSASQCNRSAADPNGACNGPVEPGGCFRGSTDKPRVGCRDPRFIAATPDGSRVFFTTTQQLVNADVDQTNDIYACDIPSGNPAPTADKANPCAAFRQVSGAQTGAAVESVFATSDNGDTVLFTAKGALADNEDALGEKALAGDHNLYVWRTDAAHPDGQTSFLARLDSNDLTATGAGAPQVTPDGRYLVFTTASRLLDTDTDTARDLYRYDADADADADKLTRVSTNVFGVAGNGADFDAQISRSSGRVSPTAISDDGQKIVFITKEALDPAADGNGEFDIYLWTPDRVSLISTGSSGYPLKTTQGVAIFPTASITGSGQDVYFESAQPLTPADGDDLADVYDARIGGGFSFAPPPICAGETCQPDPSPAPPKKAPLSAQPGPGNPPPPKPCPKGKVRNKKGKCVPKHHKKHQKKSHKKAGHNRGGSK
jgi:hypothetical protein